MLHFIEQEIIDNFIISNRKERLYWELCNIKKRENIMLKRFAGPTLFKKDCLQPVKYMPPEMLMVQLLDLGGSNQTYFMGEEYIGTLSLRDAVFRADNGEICIIYCGNGVGYYQGEELGSPPRFLLVQKRRTI